MKKKNKTGIVIRVDFTRKKPKSALDRFLLDQRISKLEKKPEFPWDTLIITLLSVAGILILLSLK